LRELAAGPDSEPISESSLVYLQERVRGRFFDFLIGRFEEARERGLNQAKLARRIRKSPEVISRWLGAPSNLTLDSITDLLAGIAAEEPEFLSSSLLNRSPVNYSHLDETASAEDSLSTPEQDQPQSNALNSAFKPLSALASIGTAQQ
jgi:transcriptional regulator with XRE-family HTH domain